MEVAGRLRLRVGAVNWDDGEPGRTGVVFKGRSRDRGRGWAGDSPAGIAEAVAGRDLGGDDGSDKWGRLVRD